MAKTEKYDVFISYRRDRGFTLAEKICLYLGKRGYRCFFDKTSIKKGEYLKVIKAAIRKSRYFLMVVTDGSIERCCDTSKVDYVREEIKCALHPGWFRKLVGKIEIIPVVSEREAQNFPTDAELYSKGLGLPPDIKAICNHQITKISSGEFFDATMESLIRNQLGGGPKQGFSARKWMLFLLLTLVAGVCVLISSNGGSLARNVRDSATGVAKESPTVAENPAPKAYADSDIAVNADVVAHDTKCLLVKYLDPMVGGSREEFKQYLSKEGDDIFKTLKMLKNDMRKCINAGMTEDELLILKPEFVARMSAFRRDEQKKIDDLIASSQYEQALRYWTTVNMRLRSFGGTPFERPKLIH